MNRSFVLVFVAAVLPAQVVPGRYIVELDGEPAIDLHAGTKARAAAADRLASVKSQQARTARQLEDRGIRILSAIERVANALVVESDQAGLAAITSLSGVQAIHPVVLHRLHLDRAVLVQKVTDAWSLVGGVGNAGRGVKIGIIDTGIDVMHPGLQDPDLTVPDGYPKVTREADISNTNNKVIVARNYGSLDSSAADVEGHGTGVAMIAAGRTNTGSRGAMTGIAPKAFLGSYKVFGDEEGAPTDVVLRAIDDAVADGMDIVNLSLGSFPSPSTSIYTSAIERANAAGVLVVVSAGNDGPAAGTVGAPAGVAAAITVGNSPNDRQFTAALRVDGFAPVAAIPGSNSAGRDALTARLRDVEAVDPSGLACSDLPAGSLTGRIALILRGVCVFTDKFDNVQRAGAVGAIVYTDADRPEAVTMSLESSTLPGLMISYADGAALKARLSAEPELSATANFISSAVAVNSARLSPSSSRGPAVAAGLKPDLLGVGTSVYSASTSTGGRTGYQVATGTSFSSPMVAGAAALLKSARPGLTAAQYRSLLVNATSTFSYDSGTPAPVQQTGAGLLNLAASVRSTIAASPHTLSFGSRTGGAEVSATVSLSNLGTVADTFSLSAEPLGGGPPVVLSEQSVSLSPNESRSVRVRLDVSALPPGQYQGFVIVRSSVSDTQARIPWWYGVPSDDVADFAIGQVPEDAAPSSNQTFYVRPSDASGLPVEVLPTVAVVSGGGTVRGVAASTVFPGFYTVRVRLGASAGINAFDVTAKGKTTRVNIVTQ